MKSPCKSALLLERDYFEPREDTSWIGLVLKDFDKPKADLSWLCIP